MATLQAAGVAAGVVQNTEDLYRDPQLRARSFFEEIPHYQKGAVTAAIVPLGHSTRKIAAGTSRTKLNRGDWRAAAATIRVPDVHVDLAFILSTMAGHLFGMLGICWGFVLLARKRIRWASLRIFGFFPSRMIWRDS